MKIKSTLLIRYVLNYIYNTIAIFYSKILLCFPLSFPLLRTSSIMQIQSIMWVILFARTSPTYPPTGPWSQEIKCNAFYLWFKVFCTDKARYSMKGKQNRLLWTYKEKHRKPNRIYSFQQTPIILPQQWSRQINNPIKKFNSH